MSASVSSWGFFLVKFSLQQNGLVFSGQVLINLI